jgi:hypothetical protein
MSEAFPVACAAVLVRCMALGSAVVRPGLDPAVRELRGGLARIDEPGQIYPYHAREQACRSSLVGAGPQLGDGVAALGAA